MDLQEFKAFTEASEAAARPFKRIVCGLLVSLVLTITLFGGSFLYFMYKAFNMEQSAVILQDVDRSIGSTNNTRIER